MKKLIPLFTALFVSVLSTTSHARPAAQHFDAQPATVQDAMVSDSACTEYGVIETPMGRERLEHYNHTYACAGFGVVIMDIEGITDVSHINQLYVDNGARILQGTYSKSSIPNGMRITFTPTQPISSGTALVVMPQSDIRVERNGQWQRFPSDIDYYVEAL
jgi:hypothetical protein